MKDLIKPDYKAQGIINLMSSISKNFGHNHKYNQSKFLKSKELSKHKNVILIVFDGLGYNYLKKKKDSFLCKHLKAKMTSTFLPTTACANTSYLTGYPPNQSGFTGWDVYLKEVGSIVSVLRFMPKHGGPVLDEHGFKMSHILPIEPCTKDYKSENYLFIDKKISKSAFTDHIAKYSKVVPITSVTDMSNKLVKKVKSKSVKRRYFHVYLPEFDGSAHEFGVNHKNTSKIFEKIDRKIEEISKKIQGTNTKLIIVSDHGFVDTTAKTRLTTDNIPGFDECLSMPLSGDARVVYAYLKKGSDLKFRKVFNKHLKDIAYLFESKKLVEKNYFGLFTPTPKLLDRVGDYTIIMKKNYAIKSKLANYKKKNAHVGEHSGTTEDEMYCPLVHIDC